MKSTIHNGRRKKACPPKTIPQAQRMTLVRSRARQPAAGRLYGDALTRLREQCFDRDGGRCQECGCLVMFHAPHTQSNSYHMAHIQAKRRGGDNLANVRTLCGDCHRKEHNWGKSMAKPVPRKGE